MKLIVTLQAFVNSLRSEDEGATAVEYGLIVALIAVALIGGATALGSTRRCRRVVVDGHLGVQGFPLQESDLQRRGRTARRGRKTAPYRGTDD